jgi:hypothetical protein
LAYHQNFGGGRFPPKQKRELHLIESGVLKIDKFKNTWGDYNVK